MHEPSSAHDDFQRPLGPGWTVYNGDVVVLDRALGLASGPGLGLVAWSGSAFSADQFSQVTVAPDKPAEALLQVFVRRRARRVPSGWARYGFHWNSRLGGRWELKLDGLEPGHVLAAVPGDGPRAGDVLRVEVVGDTLRGLRNGVEIVRVADAALPEPGEPGMAFAALPVLARESFPIRFAAAWSGGSLAGEAARPA